MNEINVNLFSNMPKYMMTFLASTEQAEANFTVAGT
jgi:hypothetical protein